MLRGAPRAAADRGGGAGARRPRAAAGRPPQGASRSRTSARSCSGEAAGALDRLLDALQLSADSGGDGVLWQRDGTLATEVGKPHLARHALEMSVAASAHNQLAAKQLRELLRSVGDDGAARHLHAAAHHALPFLPAAPPASAAPPAAPPAAAPAAAAAAARS